MARRRPLASVTLQSIVRFETRSRQETEAAGATLAARLEPGDIVLVGGELGSGKTTFVRGACRALGVDDVVTSPTFVIGQIYSGPVEVAHIDLYRLGPGALADSDECIVADYLTAARIAFVEWPSADSERFGRVKTRVRLEHLGGDRRSVEIT